MQVWSAPTGQLEKGSAQGVYLAGRRAVSEMVLTSPTHALVPTGFERLDHWIIRFGSAVQSLEAEEDSKLLADSQITLVRTRVTSPREVRERIEVTNASSNVEEVRLRLRVSPDAALLDEVRAGWSGVESAKLGVLFQDGSIRWQAGDVHAQLEADGIVSKDGEDVVIDWALTVPAGGTSTAEVTIDFMHLPEFIEPWEWRSSESGSRLSKAASSLIERSAGNPDLQAFLARALWDLDGLTLSPLAWEDDRFIASGAPWALGLSGRDALIAASLLVSVDPQLAVETLNVLARLQGKDVNRETGEEPGKILEWQANGEIRSDDDDDEGAEPRIYFGAAETTPLWILTLFEVWKTGAYKEEVRELLPNLECGLDWMREFGDAVGGGFFEPRGASGAGAAAEGWRSCDGPVRWRNGSLAQGPFVFGGVQALAYSAALAGAEILEAFGRAHVDIRDEFWREAELAREWAAGLKRRFREQFWVERGGLRYPAGALDALGRPVDSLTSNIGYVLGSGMLDESEVDDVVEALMSPEMFSGYGVRASALVDNAFDLFDSYRGVVWVRDTAMVARGLRREGRVDEARRLALGLLEAAREFDWTLPEAFSGVSRDEEEGLRAHPSANRPSGLAAAAALAVAEVLLDS